MKRVDQVRQCEECNLASPCGIAIVAIGNPLRGDDGIAAAVCKMIQPGEGEHICRFDLGPFSNLLLDCIKGHAAAILVDATSNGTQVGTVTTVDLNDSLFGKLPVNLSASHGFSLLNELQVGRNLGLIPRHVKFFGIEASKSTWGEKISPVLEARLPELCDRLLNLIQEVREESSNA